MTVNLTLLVVMGVMYSVGVYLLLERSMTRVLLGIMLLTNATNLLILHAGGAPGFAPLYNKDLGGSEYSDPLPQALILTAIVISLATTAFILSMIYRSWTLARRDEIQDDLEDRRVAQQSAYDAEDDDAMPQDSSEFTDSDTPPVRPRHNEEEATESPGHHRAQHLAAPSSPDYVEHAEGHRHEGHGPEDTGEEGRS